MHVCTHTHKVHRALVCFRLIWWWEGMTGILEVRVCLPDLGKLFFLGHCIFPWWFELLCLLCLFCCLMWLHGSPKESPILKLSFQCFLEPDVLTHLPFSLLPQDWTSEFLLLVDDVYICFQVTAQRASQKALKVMISQKSSGSLMGLSLIPYPWEHRGILAQPS